MMGGVQGGVQVSAGVDEYFDTEHFDMAHRNTLLTRNNLLP